MATLGEPNTSGPSNDYFKQPNRQTREEARRFLDDAAVPEGPESACVLIWGLELAKSGTQRRRTKH
eukprot:14095898-Alexandrium_andersonii.AAC.1